jgi:hypothetical protein
VRPDGAFTAALVPFDPPVVTPSGCAVRDLAVERIDAVAILAAGDGLEGRGWLTYQTLTGMDNDQLQSGDLGELRATLALWLPE